MSASAIFLDRDGTIIEDVGYVDDPEQVRLLPRAAEAIRSFADAGYLVVVISNQSGIARGLFDEEALSRVHNRIESLLRAQGARLDGAYYCPYLDGPEAKVEAYRRDSELRKPKPGMLFQAAEELGIDLSRSWMIGDAPRDAEAGRAAGCQTIMIAGRSESSAVAPTGTKVVGSLWEAAQLIVPEPVLEPSQAQAAQGHRAGSERDVPASLGDVVHELRGISDQMERAQRGQRQNDFSVLRLFGALLQMFAIVSGTWGALALLNDQNAAATGRLLLAAFFQLATLTAFFVDRFK